jgi:hypothetical protein
MNVFSDMKVTSMFLVLLTYLLFESEILTVLAASCLRVWRFLERWKCSISGEDRRNYPLREHDEIKAVIALTHTRSKNGRDYWFLEPFRIRLSRYQANQFLKLCHNFVSRHSESHDTGKNRNCVRCVIPKGMMTHQADADTACGFAEPVSFPRHMTQGASRANS